VACDKTKTPPAQIAALGGVLPQVRIGVELALPKPSRSQSGSQVLHTPLAQFDACAHV
jgi:hypothetical protein